MRLVFVNRYFFPDDSATSQLLADLAFHLTLRGAAVTVVTSRQRYQDPTADLPRRENITGVHVARVWSTRFGRTRLIGRAVDYLSFYAATLWFLWFHLRSGDTVVSKTDP